MQMTVIIEDNYISIDGVGLFGGIPETENIRAIQSDGGKTHIEKINGDGYFDDDFDLQPFVDAHSKMVEDMEAAQAAAEAEANSDMNVWKREMSALDKYMPRALEATIDAFGTDGYDEFIVEKYEEKIAKRAEQPDDQ